MIKVTGPRLLVRPYKIEENDAIVRSAKAAGIEIPEFSRRKEEANVDKGILLAVGPTADKIYTEGAEIGDTIGFAKFGGKFVIDPKDNIHYLVINDEDLICVFKD